jgi:hypothetical protein
MTYNYKTTKKRSGWNEKNLVEDIKRVGQEIGHRPSKAEYDKWGQAYSSTVRRVFDTYNKGLIAAGYDVVHPMNLTDEEIFTVYAKLWKKLDREPTPKDVNESGKFTWSTIKKRFNGRRGFLPEFGRWAESKGESVNWGGEQDIDPKITSQQIGRLPKSKKTEYGERIDFEGLRHAPINELGVVFLFGMLCKEMGYDVEVVKAAFPDCEAKRRIAHKAGRLERVKIEFEFKSSNFRKQRHPIDGCDLIICWEHDWKECQIEVLPLKDYLAKHLIT